MAKSLCPLLIAEKTCLSHEFEMSLISLLMLFPKNNSCKNSEFTVNRSEYVHGIWNLHCIASASSNSDQYLPRSPHSTNHMCVHVRLLSIYYVKTCTKFTCPGLLADMRESLYEPRHEISNNVVCATSKGSDQPAHTRSLIRAFAARLNIL